MAHLGFSIKEGIIHIDVYHHSTVTYLVAGYRERLFVVLLLDKSEKLARASHIAAFADIDKHTLPNLQRLQSTQLQIFTSIAGDIGLLATSKIHVAGDKMVISTTAATDDIEYAFIYQSAYLGSHSVGSLVV